MSSTVCYELMPSSKPPVLKFGNRLRSPEKIFLRWNDKIIIEWHTIHHHRADQNPPQKWSLPQRNLRYTIRPIEDAINFFHARQGLRH